MMEFTKAHAAQYLAIEPKGFEVTGWIGEGKSVFFKPDITGKEGPVECWTIDLIGLSLTERAELKNRLRALHTEEDDLAWRYPGKKPFEGSFQQLAHPSELVIEGDTALLLNNLEFKAPELNTSKAAHVAHLQEERQR